MSDINWSHNLWKGPFSLQPMINPYHSFTSDIYYHIMILISLLCLDSRISIFLYRTLFSKTIIFSFCDFIQYPHLCTIHKSWADYGTMHSILVWCYNIFVNKTMHIWCISYNPVLNLRFLSIINWYYHLRIIELFDLLKVVAFNE